MWRIRFTLEHICLHWMFFSFVLHRQRAHRSLRADKAVSCWVCTCPIINTTPKESSEERTKQTKEGRRTGKQASTLRVDFSLHTLLKPTKTTAMNPTKTGRNPTSFGTSFCPLTSFLPGQMGWARRPLWHHNTCWSLPVTPPLDWHVNPAPKSRTSRHITQ